MAFTIILALLALLGLMVVFGVAYKIKGWKAALLSTGIALAAFFLLYVAAISLIVSQM